jgi:hypothetical protein
VFLESTTLNEVNSNWYIILSAGDGFSESKILQTSPSFKAFYIPATTYRGFLTSISSTAARACNVIRNACDIVAKVNILEINDTNSTNGFTLSLWKKDVVNDISTKLSICLEEVPKAVNDTLDTQKKRAALLFLYDIPLVKGVVSFIFNDFEQCDKSVIRVFDIYNFYKESKYFNAEDINTFIDKMKSLNYNVVKHTKSGVYKSKPAFIGLKKKVSDSA